MILNKNIKQILKNETRAPRPPAIRTLTLTPWIQLGGSVCGIADIRCALKANASVCVSPGISKKKVSSSHHRCHF